MLPAPAEPRTTEKLPARPEPGQARTYLAMLGDHWLPIAEDLAFMLVGAYRTSMVNDSEVIVLSAVPTLEFLSWRQAVRAGVNVSASWCLCSNGHHVRLVDAEHAYARSYVEYDLYIVADDPHAFSVFWGVLRAD